MYSTCESVKLNNYDELQKRLATWTNNINTILNYIYLYKGGGTLCCQRGGVQPKSTLTDQYYR
jgi:hypothetical protein